MSSRDYYRIFLQRGKILMWSIIPKLGGVGHASPEKFKFTISETISGGFWDQVHKQKGYCILLFIRLYNNYVLA